MNPERRQYGLVLLTPHILLAILHEPRVLRPNRVTDPKAGERMPSEH
jgi:hypothetical protein